MPELVEVRCPNGPGPGRLFSKLNVEGQDVRYLRPENWIEMACADCRNQLRREGTVVERVLHRYAFTGELVETVLVGGQPSS